MTKPERQLRQALRDAAQYRDTSDADWQKLQSRITEPSAEHRPSTHRHSRWRTPVLAAAAVVAIAVATTAIVTGGFGGSGNNQQAAGPGGSTAEPTAPVKVPVAREGVAVAPAGGVAVDRSDGAAANQPAHTTSPADNPATNSDVTLTMGFVDGEPPDATLIGSFETDSVLEVSRVTPTSDATPLGYLTTSAIPVGSSADASYLWGAVGPNVAQVQVSMPDPPVPGKNDPGFNGVVTMWTIDSGEGTPWSLPEASDVAWTELQPGWHGFAIPVRVGTTVASAVALGKNGAMIQQRQYDLATGDVTDETLPPATTAFVSVAPPTAPPSQTEIPAISSPDPPPNAGSDQVTPGVASDVSGTAPTTARSHRPG